MQMEQTEIQQEEDEERFHKLQMTDAANFNDKLDSLSVSACIVTWDYIVFWSYDRLLHVHVVFI